MRRSLWALAIAAPVLVLLASGFGHDPNAIRSPIVGHAAPSFQLQSFDGRPVSFAALKGKPVILNFWASWCLSCKDEHQALLAAWRQYGSRGVSFVGVDYNDRIGDARSFLQKHGGGWPELRDPAGETAIDYGVYGVPETYFIDRNGVVVYKSTGPVTPDVLTREIRKMLG
jgi:cytochrome c biogenesis protein CcmG/thiol:disulfide interchange protein DsbE